MVERRLTVMIAAAAVLIVLFIMWDIFRPERTASTELSAPPPPPPPPPAELVTIPAPPPAGVTAGTTQTTAGGALPPTEYGREPSYIDLLARSETRRRIRASAGVTYLNEMVSASEDSMLRRWDNRSLTPVRVWFAPTHAANYQPAFIDAIRRAFGQWTAAGVPVRFDFTADSTNAEVAIRWRIQFEIERTGQTDLTWDQNGHVQSAVVTLATFDPKGRPMAADDVRVVALHEVGHLLGLDHSDDSTDIMYPTAKVRDLSERDVRTALLLYQLVPGSLR